MFYMFYICFYMFYTCLYMFFLQLPIWLKDLGVVCSRFEIYVNNWSSSQLGMPYRGSSQEICVAVLNKDAGRDLPVKT